MKILNQNNNLNFLKTQDEILFWLSEYLLHKIQITKSKMGYKEKINYHVLNLAIKSLKTPPLHHINELEPIIKEIKKSKLPISKSLIELYYLFKKNNVKIDNYELQNEFNEFISFIKKAKKIKNEF